MLSITRSLLVAAVACAALALAAPAGATPLFGFNDNAAPAGQLTVSQDVSLAQQAGVTTLRTTFDWRWAQPQPGTLRLNIYDSLYQAALAKGIKPIFQLMFAPSWALSPSTPCNQYTQTCMLPPGPTHDDAWKSIVTTLVNRYPQLAALEIWNEPNLTNFWQSGPDPVRFATLVREADDAAHAAGSKVPIVSGGIARFDGINSVGYDSRQFLATAYANGMAGHLDGIGLHPYPGSPDDGRFFEMLTEAREIRDRAGDGAIPLWITELGISTSTGADTELQQAAILTRLRTKLMAMPDVRAVAVHTMVDNPRYPVTNLEYGYGFLHADLTPKLAWCALGGTAATTPGCKPVGNLSLGTTQDARWKAQDLLEAAVNAARTYRRTNGTYSTLTAAALSKIDSQLSATAQSPSAAPGSAADPRRIYVYVSANPNTVLLCNVSTADMAYCAYTADSSNWTDRSAPGSIYYAAGAATTQTTSLW